METESLGQFASAHVSPPKRQESHEKRRHGGGLEKRRL
jgi:hypothetical protein